MQSLVRKGVVHDCVGSYGHLVVDECHHLPASSFELVARRAKARYVTGLSASITRKDGHQPIIFMQCGPVRYRVNARQQAALAAFHSPRPGSSYGLPRAGHRSSGFASRVPAALRGFDPGSGAAIS